MPVFLFERPRARVMRPATSRLPVLRLFDRLFGTFRLPPPSSSQILAQDQRESVARQSGLLSSDITGGGQVAVRQFRDGDGSGQTTCDRLNWLQHFRGVDVAAADLGAF